MEAEGLVGAEGALKRGVDESGSLFVDGHFEIPKNLGFGKELVWRVGHETTCRIGFFEFGHLSSPHRV